MPFLTYPNALELQKELKGTNAEIITLADDDYLENLGRWGANCEKEAVGVSPSSQIIHKHNRERRLTDSDTMMLIKGAIVKVTSAEEVSMVVAFAAKRYVPFTVLASGYSTSSASSTYGGIVIDLERLNKVQVDSSSRTVSVQGGAKWADVDAVAAQHGLAVVGATVGQLGVGGTTLGGGIGWLTGKYGLSVDNLLEVEIILADASITTASETENSDLFWAIRGAGQDFGVITKFIFKAHPQENDVFAGIIYLNPDKMPALVKFANDFDSSNDGNQGLFFGFTSSGKTITILAILFYNGPRDEAEALFAPLLSLDTIYKNIGMMPYLNANGILSGVAANEGRKRLSGTSVTFPLDLDFFQSVYRHFYDILEAYPDAGDALLFFEMLPYTEVLKVPNNATAYANRGPYYNVCSIFIWQDQNLDSKVRTLQQGLINQIREEHITKRKQGVGMYANFTGTSNTCMTLLTLITYVMFSMD